MLPERWIPCSERDGQLLPRYLDERDAPWLRALLDDYRRYAGRRQRELQERLREPVPGAGSQSKRLLAIDVLDRLSKGRSESAVAPRRARTAVFGEATRTRGDREAALAAAAASLGVEVAALEASLFADLPGERLVAPPEPFPAPHELALRANLLLAQSLLFRASSVAIDLQGNARTIVRHAKLRGLLCTVRGPAQRGMCSLEISGPLSLFRHTLLYGRALGELLPLLSWCDRFRLSADCRLSGRRGRLVVRPGDPLFPSSEPRRYDSRIEERFAREFARLALDWDVIREPEAVRAGETLIFPDFALVHRREPSRRWLLEIVGFWTPDYVERKLARLQAAGLDNLILCVDEDRNCGEGALAGVARLVRFRRKVEPHAVLAAMSR